MSQSAHAINRPGKRRVLSGIDEVREAIIGATLNANRVLAIQTPNLEPQLYDQWDFLEALKRFVLARGFARVRILITEPRRALRSGNNFVTMARRLNSYIEFRDLRPELGECRDAFFIADEREVIYRARQDSWEAMADRSEPAIARHYLDRFDALWHACADELEVRLSQI